MTAKLGELGRPRLGIALIWLLPGKAENGPGEMAPVSDEELEQFRQETGLDIEDLVSELQRLGAEYEKDPAGMRAEMLRITGGDSKVVDLVVELMQVAQPDGDGDGDVETETEGGGRVIPLWPPTREDDEEDDEPR